MELSLKVELCVVSPVGGADEGLKKQKQLGVVPSAVESFTTPE